jgi:hypothetical protein
LDGSDVRELLPTGIGVVRGLDWSPDGNALLVSSYGRDFYAGQTHVVRGDGSGFLVGGSAETVRAKEALFREHVAEATREVAVQVNGKLCDRVTVPADVSPDDLGDGAVSTATGLTKSFGPIEAVKGIDLEGGGCATPTGRSFCGGVRPGDAHSGGPNFSRRE